MNFTNIKYNIALILLAGATSLSAAQEAAFDPAGRAYINGIRAEQFDLPFVAAYDAPNLADAEPLVAAELAAHDAPDSPQPEYP
jgi:hypothetical protein